MLKVFWRWEAELARYVWFGATGGSVVELTVYLRVLRCVGSLAFVAFLGMLLCACLAVVSSVLYFLVWCLPAWFGRATAQWSMTKVLVVSFSKEIVVGLVWFIAYYRRSSNAS